jgi:hypothetical protein
MTHEDGPHYSGKHPQERIKDETLKQAILDRTAGGQVPCATAFEIAQLLDRAPAEVGRAVDLLDFKLIKCQLGLYGYQPEKKIVTPEPPENPAMEQAIRSRLVDGRLPCERAWAIARQFKVQKMRVSAACEALGIKIKPCQLGAF